MLNNPAETKKMNAIYLFLFSREKRFSFQKDMNKEVRKCREKQ